MNIVKRTVPLIALASGLVLAAGCELIASVDHDLIGSTSTGGGSQGGATSSSSEASTSSESSSSSSSSGSSSSSTGGGCTDPSTCPMPAAECDEATCDNMTCGQDHKAAHQTCSTGVCDGNGACVGCVDNTDCSGATPSCSAANKCVAASCTNGMKDPGETDKDCGGSCGPTCPNTDICAGPGDCLSGVCTALVCIGCAGDGDCQTGNYCDTPGVTTGVCKPKIGNGISCGGDNQCTSGACVDVTGSNPDKICCTSACTGGCDSCLAVENGDAMDGTCDPITVGTDPKNACATSGTDCNTGSCNGSGMCGVDMMTTACGPASTCAADLFTAQSTCNGTSGTCPAPGSPTPCANHFACADATSCATMCSATGTAPMGTSVGCASGYFCDTVPTTPVCSNTLKPATDPCNNDYECVSGVCTGNACQ